MAKAGYTASTEGAVALAASTAKTVLAVIAPAQFGIDLQGIKLAFDGVTSSAVPALVELVRYTSDGTGTSATVDQVYGPTVTAGFTAKKNYSAEPTGATSIDEWLLTPDGGTLFERFPLGQTPDTAVSVVIGIRVTAPAVVNCRATMWFERT
jgi:hypothetical protein